ncbi:hypothetical protein NFJ02_35g89240 [Pycnococcus provasolii]
MTGRGTNSTRTFQGTMTDFLHYNKDGFVKGRDWNQDVHPIPSLINRSDRPIVSSTGWNPLASRWSPARPGWKENSFVDSPEFSSDELTHRSFNGQDGVDLNASISAKSVYGS